jgi:RimJ/RimL family protein N-acetyltransferase
MDRNKNSYKVLLTNEFTVENYSIVPIRFKDRMDIMKWRNEQIYHLRQEKPLTTQDQDHYFNTVVAKLFNQTEPNQILFSYLENDVCIGYGGLVHVNWIDKNAEISFVMNSNLEKYSFQFHWETYLSLIEKVAFRELNFYKIFTYAFDFRPKIYKALENMNYTREAVLKEHCFFEGKFKDVIIHSKFNTKKTT